MNVKRLQGKTYFSLHRNWVNSRGHLSYKFWKPSTVKFLDIVMRIIKIQRNVSTAIGGGGSMNFQRRLRKTHTHRVVAYFFKHKFVHEKNVYFQCLHWSRIIISGILTLTNLSDSTLKFSRCFTCHSTKATKACLKGKMWQQW